MPANVESGVAVETVTSFENKVVIGGLGLGDRYCVVGGKGVLIVQMVAVA